MKDKKNIKVKKIKDPITAKVVSQLENPSPIDTLPVGNSQVAQ